MNTLLFILVHTRGPLPCKFSQNVHRWKCAHPPRICLRQNVVMTSSTSYPSPVPSKANLIEDPAVHHMLSQLQYSPVQTTLSCPLIHTSHVISRAKTTSEKSSSVPALLFFHGFDSNLLEYRFVLQQMRKASVDLHFIDLLGWGLTERPLSKDFRYGPYERRVHLQSYIDQFIDPSQPIILIGASIGGAVAIDFVLNSTRSVHALVLIDAQAFTDRPKSFFSGLPGVASAGAKVLRSDWLRRLAIDMAYYDPSFKNDDILRIGGLHCYQPGWTQATEDMVRSEGYCLKHRIPEIDLPTLVLWGEHDRVLPKQDASMFEQTIRNCRLQIIKECGHSPHIEKPMLVSDAILDFIAHLEFPST